MPISITLMLFSLEFCLLQWSHGHSKLSSSSSSSSSSYYYYYYYYYYHHFKLSVKQCALLSQQALHTASAYHVT